MSVEALLAELHDERRAIAERVVERIRTEMPSFDAVPRAEQTDGVEVMIGLLIGARMEDANPAVGDGTRLLREIGERRARQGVPVDDLLRAWRIGLDEITARGRELAERSDVSPAQLFDLLRQASGLADEAMVSIAGGHRADPNSGDPLSERRAALVSGALLGRLSANELHSGFAALGLDPLATYHAFRARHTADSDLERVSRALEPNRPGSQMQGLVAVIEHELVGFSIAPVPRGGLELIALGPAVAAAELPSSYRSAGRVLAAAECFGLAGVHDLSSAGLLAAVIEDPELGDVLSSELVAPVLDQKGGAELLASVREWLAAGMRVDPAAARLHVHANTVRYRLRRYEELTGADLGETEDAFRVWWALHREAATATA